MLLPLQLQLNLRSGGAVAYSLSGSAGSYSLTGQPGTFKVARNLSGSAGSYSITGQAGAFKVARNLSGAAGSYSLTGQTGGFKVGRLLSGAAGAYSFTGQAATLSYVQNVPPQTGGGSGAHYNTSNLDPKHWAKNRRKLEARIKAVQKKIVKKREELQWSKPVDMQAITRQLMALQIQLMELLAKLDEMKKRNDEAEDAEVLAIYLAYRRLH